MSDEEYFENSEEYNENSVEMIEKINELYQKYKDNELILNKMNCLLL